MFRTLVTAAALLIAFGTAAQPADSPVPSFEATALTGKAVHSNQLIGQPTILIVMPSRDAAQQTREWADALEKRVDQKMVRIRAVIAIDLPFFMDEQDALDRARQKVPERYHDQTWLFGKDKLETALDIPAGSRKAFVIVLDADGSMVTNVSGGATDRRVNTVAFAIQSIR